MIEAPPIADQHPLMVCVLDVGMDVLVECYLHPQREPALAMSIAIGRALANQVARPSFIEVETDSLLSTVRATLPGATVEVGACAKARAAVTGAFEALRSEMEQGAARAEQETWAARGVPLALARRFHEAAAAFYIARPWDIIPDDGCAFVLDSDDGTLRESTVIVLGQSKLVYGALVHHSLSDWRKARRADLDEDRAALPARLAVDFSGVDDIPAPSLEEIKRHRLPLAGPVAVPWLMACGEGASMIQATIDDTKRVELVLQTITTLFTSPAASAFPTWRTREPLPTQVVVDGIAVRVRYATAVD
jgi:hypothetical protein